MPTSVKAAITLKVNGVPDISAIVKLHGHEELSGLFQFSLEVLGADIELTDVLGQDAVLQIDGVTDSRYVHGIVSSIEHLGYTRGNSLHEATRLAAYMLTLVPRAWLLTQRQNCRIFQHKTTPEILQAVLKSAKIPKSEVKLDLTGSYQARNYCVQYRESDFSFISRLMEEDGIYYYFEHTESAATLVIGDHPDAHLKIAGDSELKLAPSGLARENEHIDTIKFRASIRPGRVRLRDLNLHTPDKDMEALHSGDTDTDLEIYDYPAEYQDPASGGPEKGTTMAKIRLEALHTSKQVGHGTSDCPRLTPGHTFTLSGHEKSEHNTEQLLTRVAHSATQPQVLGIQAEGEFSYQNSFTLLDKRIPFRPPRKTPRPFVRGLQSATVVGPNSEEIHTDDEGRVLVQFHWDRDGAMDEESSCWVRVSQAWGGSGMGIIFTPRIGHEVLISFLEGDPDRPVITGRLYHGVNLPPYELPSEKTKSTIKTMSTPGGGGFNELRFEDSAGDEQIYIHAQKDWDTEVLNNKTLSVGNDSTSDIGHNRTITVGNDRSKSVGNNQTVMVGNDHTETIGNNETETIGNNRTVSVGTNHNESIGANMSIQVGANLSENVGANLTEHVGGTKSETVIVACSESIGAAKSLAVGAAYQVSVGAAMNETVGLAKMEEVGLAKVVMVGAMSSETVGASKTVKATTDITHSAGKNVGISAGKDASISAGKNISISSGQDMGVGIGKKLNIDAGTQVSLVCGGVNITIKKNGDVVLNAKKIKVKASGKITIKGSKISLN